MQIDIDDVVLKRLLELSRMRNITGSKQEKIAQAIESGLANWSAQILDELGGQFPDAVKVLDDMRRKKDQIK